MENKYGLSDVVFFVHGTKVVKGVIDELIVHTTQKEVIVKYMIRPYGLDKFVTIDEEQIYKEMKDGINKVVIDLKNTYTKGNIVNNFRTAKKQMESRFNEQMEGFEENMKKAQENIETINEKYYDDLEKKYQKTLRKEIKNAKEAK